MGSYRLGVDVGGTNTDLVIYDEVSGAQLVEKVPSTPSNPAIAILNGIDRFVTRGISPDDIRFFAHGTTVTTNALLELKGSRIGLFITDGYTGVIDVQTQARAGNMFDYTFKRPASLIATELIRQIAGRIDSRGLEITPLDIDAVREGTQELAAAGIRSFAICYMFSFMNPAHERVTAAIIRSVIPEATISMSSSVMPRIREWPRFSTTLLNAYLEPILMQYIHDLSKGLDRLGVQQPQRFLMQSNGGVMPFSGVGSNAVHTLLSGPAAGVQGSCHLLATDAFPNLLTIDIGGTSCDIAFIEGGTPHEVSECTIEGRQVDLPCLDIVTIPAGGGTVARVDRGGFLVVGPESAGALPGPACFGRGGIEPTVTDAYIVCGFLSEDSFLGGSQEIDPAAAYHAMETYLAKPLGMTVAQAAAGVFRIINARIADEIRLHAAKKGIDLKTFTLVAFGGAGPVHAAAVAEELGIDKFMIPSSPGAFSAVGLLCSDVVHDFLRSDLVDIGKLTPEVIERHFADLRTEATAALLAEKLKLEDCTFTRELDMRYAGQGYELRMSVDHLIHDGTTDLNVLRDAFNSLHEQQHGHSARDAVVEIVSYRLRARIKTNKIALPTNNEALTSLGAIAVQLARDVRFGPTEVIKTPVVRRVDLVRMDAYSGPAVVVQFDTTTIIPPGWVARTDARGNMIVQRSVAS